MAASSTHARKRGRPPGGRLHGRRHRKMGVRLHAHELAPLERAAAERIWPLGTAARELVLAAIDDGVRALDTAWGAKGERRAHGVTLALAPDQAAAIEAAALRDGHATVAGYVRAMLARLLGAGDAP